MIDQQLTAFLSGVNLNIREAHVYSTTDGFCLDVFVVDGWEMEVNFKNADALSVRPGSPPRPWLTGLCFRLGDPQGKKVATPTNDS
jgi:hypothetical protein